MQKLSARDAIDALRTRSRMFLKKDSVRDLSIFLTGYCFGLDAACPDEFPHGDELARFRHWLASRLKGQQHDELETLLLTASNNDDAEAFQQFFVLWDEYVARGGVA